MLTERTGKPGRTAWIEGGLLLAVTPFLLFPTYFVEGTIIALFLVAATWLLPLLVARQPLLPPTPFNVAFLPWGLMLIVGIVVTADPDLTLPKATGLILGFAAWRYLVRTARNRQWLHTSIAILGLLGIGFVLLGALSTNWLFKIPLFDTVLHRFPSLLIGFPGGADTGVHPNQLAGTILIYPPLLVSALIGWRPDRLPKLVLAGASLLTLLAIGLLILTQSRSGWIGGAGGLLVLLFLWGMVLSRSNKRRVIRLTLVILIGVGILGLAWIGPERLKELWEDPAQETAVGQLASVSFRQEVWRWALVSIGDFPFTGTGLGSFRQVTRRLYPLNVQADYDIAHAHNIFFQVALDIGLPGLIAYLAILIIAGAVGWQVAKQDERLRPLALGLLAGLAALHIYGLTDALALGSKTSITFWVALGLLTAMHQMVQER